MRPIKHTRKKKQRNLYICTWNVKTLSEVSHLTNLINEIKDLKWHVIGLIDVRRPGEKLVETKEHHLLYHNGKEVLKQSGVGFFVHKDLKPKVKEFYGISD